MQSEFDQTKRASTAGARTTWMSLGRLPQNWARVAQRELLGSAFAVTGVLPLLRLQWVLTWLAGLPKRMSRANAHTNSVRLGQRDPQKDGKSNQTFAVNE